MRATQRRILCVDDDDDTCEMLSALLGHAGYEMKSASGMAEGLRLARNERFDLYILDNCFSDGTGLELLPHIRELLPAAPIIFFSGLAHESDRRHGLEAGAQDYLVKPNDLGRLVKTVKQLLEGHEASLPPALNVSPSFS